MKLLAHIVCARRHVGADAHSPAFPVAGGQYLTVAAAKGPGGRAARLLLPLGHLMHSGDLCLSFRHKVTGLHSSTLQVFLRKHGAHTAALWGRNGGHGWRQTQITLRGADVRSVSRTAKEADGGGVAVTGGLRALSWERSLHSLGLRQSLVLFLWAGDSVLYLFL